jgi:ketosteroid isomerase-like protein
MLMKRVALLTGALAIAGGLYGLFSPIVAHADDAAQIRAAQESIAAGAEARDLNAIMSNYLHSDKLYVFDVYPPRAYIGWDAFRKDWDNFLQTYKGPIIYKMVDMDVDTDGKLGCVHVIEHIAGTDKQGKKKELNLRVTEIYRKISGKWQIVHEHASVPVDLKTDKADVLSSE